MTVFFIGLTNGAVFALVALGYTLVYGILELINFAHGDVFMLGGMISATFITLASSACEAARRSAARPRDPRPLVAAMLSAACSTRRSSSSPTGRYAGRLDLRR